MRAVIWVISGLAAVLMLVMLPVLQPQTVAARSGPQLAAQLSAHGFFSPQTDPSGAQYTWTEPNASTRFQYIGKLPSELVLSIRSAAAAGGPDAPIHVLINGRETFQLRPDPGLSTFETFHLLLPPQTGGGLHIAIQSEPFRPHNGDRRVLGAMVQSIAVSQRAAWSLITRHAWLYAALPVLAALATACVVLARRVPAAPAGVPWWALVLRPGAALCCLGGAGCMVAALSLLWRIGRIDAARYLFWVAGSAYLGGFFAAAAVHVPLRTAGRGIWSASLRSAFVVRRRAALIMLRDGLVFALTTLLAVQYLRAPGTGDVQDKVRWMGNIASQGLVRGFQISKDDYPPGSYVILAAVTKVAPHLHIGFLLGYKLSLLVFLLLSSLAVFLWTRNAPLTAVVQLVLIVDSMILGYNDVYFIPPLVLALWALKARKPVGFSVLFTLTCMMKWQPLVLVPVLLIYAVATMTTAALRGRDLARLAAAIILPAAAILATVLAIFGVEFLAEFRRATTENFLSANALNLDWIVTHLLAWWDPARFAFGGETHRQYIRVASPALLALLKLPFALMYGGILVRFARAPKTFAALLHYAYVGYLAYFLLNTSVHENHLVPAIVLGALLWAGNPRYAPLFLAAAVLTNLNLLLFYNLDGVARLPLLVRGVDVTLVLAVVATALFMPLLVHGSRLVARAADDTGIRMAPAGAGARGRGEGMIAVQEKSGVG